MATHFKGNLHIYSPGLQAFEFQSKSEQKAKNAIIFIGGLGDSLLTVPYVPFLNEALPSNWGLFQITITSSKNGWGTGSLDRDVKEIGQAVQYLKGLGKEKIVVFGHSTGSQDSIHYLLRDGRDISGIVLQAPVSDRETLSVTFAEEKLGNLEDWNNEARQILDAQGPDTVLPKKFSDAFFGAPLSAYRWLSLAAVGGDDDYFSSDLSDERLQNTFGKLSKPTLVLYSGSDEYSPKGADKEGLIARWKNFTPDESWSKYSRVVKGATHNVGEGSEPGAVDSLIEAVLGFLNDL